MVLKKTQRLKGKEVRFLLKKRNVFYSGIFVFYYYSQYPAISHHQLSLHVPLLISKKAVSRHRIKRACLAKLPPNFLQTAITGKYYKVFITFNKKQLSQQFPQSTQFSASLLAEKVSTLFQNSFTSFVSFLWKNQPRS